MFITIRGGVPENLQRRYACITHAGRRSYLQEDREWSGIFGLGSIDDFAVERPVGSLDGKGVLRQVAAEDCAGLIADLPRVGNDVWGLR